MGAYLLQKGYEMSIIEIPISRFKQDPKFEYDPNKSAANLEKHGIDFEQAQELWKDKIVTIPSPGDHAEQRYVVLGLIEGKHWTAVVTFRGVRIRLISVRRSRIKEASYYDAKED